MEDLGSYNYPFWTTYSLGPVVYALAVLHALLWGLPSAIVGSIVSSYVTNITNTTTNTIPLTYDIKQTALLSVTYISAVGLILFDSAYYIKGDTGGHYYT